MNSRLILQLSLFGLAMGVGTVFFIPSRIEPAFWLVIFAICAFVIAKQCPAKRFLHGELLGIANSVWITGAHVLLFDRYIANHAAEAGMMRNMPISPKPMMIVAGVVSGIVSGVVIGLLALIAGRILKKPAASAASA